jgi:hypothetical protein
LVPAAPCDEARASHARIPVLSPGSTPRVRLQSQRYRPGSRRAPSASRRAQRQRPRPTLTRLDSFFCTTLRICGPDGRTSYCPKTGTTRDRSCLARSGRLIRAPANQLTVTLIASLPWLSRRIRCGSSSSRSPVGSTSSNATSSTTFRRRTALCEGSSVPDVCGSPTISAVG